MAKSRVTSKPKTKPSAGKTKPKPSAAKASGSAK